MNEAEQIRISLEQIKNGLRQGAAARRGEQHRRLTDEAFDLAMSKNTEYADAIAATGMVGCVAELMGIAFRARELVRQGLLQGGLTEGQRKQLRDKAIDGINYAVWLAAFLEEDNLFGKG